jgi:hypothetical protein
MLLVARVHRSVLALSAEHLQHVLDEYRTFVNAARPPQGIGQREPSLFDSRARKLAPAEGVVIMSRSVLGGLHHDNTLRRDLRFSCRGHADERSGQHILDSRLLTAVTESRNDNAPVARRERLGGLLNYYRSRTA